MDDQGQATNLEELLDELTQAGEKDGKVSVGALIECVGRRSFGPLLMLAGLIALSPASGIPGMPTTVATLVVVVAVQFLLRRDHFWLPQWLLNRKVQHKRLCKMIKVLRRPAIFIDRFLRPRLVFMTHHAGIYAIAILCIIIAATMPPLEIMPFAATAAGAALATFGLALISNDGLVGLIAVAITGVVAGLVSYSFL
ncbi:MAG: exopolysaccharide biosynthesis protein [Woeseia sp.]